MKLLRKSGFLGAIIAAATFAGAAGAGEVTPGTVLDKNNIDALMNETLDGKRIGDLLTERIEWQIREYNLRPILQHTKELKLDPRYVARDAINKANVRLNPETKLVENWEAGQPFPDPDPNDPDIALKLMYNQYYAAPEGYNYDFPKFAYLLTDGRSGLERVQHWQFARNFLKGRWNDPNGQMILGDGKIQHKTLLVAHYPFDIRGLGLFFLRTDDKDFDDGWVFLRSVRRTRKLTGGTWMDPIGATDQLTDDLEIFNAHPLWYDHFEYIGRRWVLAVANSITPVWMDNGEGGNSEYPQNDFERAPYWNPIQNWEPREVHIIDGIAPEAHPYSHKVMYMDVLFPRFYFGEAYDKKGDFWKFINFGSIQTSGLDGTISVHSLWGLLADFKRMHSTMFVTIDKNRIFNDPTKDASWISLGMLEKIGGR